MPINFIKDIVMMEVAIKRYPKFKNMSCSGNHKSNTNKIYKIKKKKYMVLCHLQNFFNYLYKNCLNNNRIFIS